MSDVINMQEQPQEQGPKFDPAKKYIWPHDASFKLSGSEFGLLLNALRVITSTKEAQSIILAKDAGDVLENILGQAVETGVVIEAPQQ